ncbi:unnamed protein product [Blepharisma stoltei]|uniref:LITAF domain-containing protein n=1 Tax=Blepharisma stoltei TaxID=1481888 RepID=A0AAU9J9V1_9CILI|nr:unnamed protein product [Blepharisma stoltei]
MSKDHTEDEALTQRKQENKPVNMNSQSGFYRQGIPYNEMVSSNYPYGAYPGITIYVDSNYKPEAPMGSNIVVVESTSARKDKELLLSKRPVLISCPYCNHRELTRIERKPGILLWVLCILLLLVFPLCSCLAFLCTGLYDVEHYCKRCSRRLGGLENFQFFK